MSRRIPPFILAAALVAGCGGGSPEAPPPPAGRYAYAREGSRLLALSLDSRATPIVVADGLAPEADFAQPVERSGDAGSGLGRYHDLILFNGGRVYRLAGFPDGRSPLARELGTGGAVIRACGHAGGPDDAAVTTVRSRTDESAAEIDVRFVAATGCIDASGDRTLSIPVSTGTPVAHAADEFRVGLQANGAALGTLRVDGASLAWRSIVDGVERIDPLAPTPADATRLQAWQLLARDAQGAVLCARIDDARRCALYRFSPVASPRLARIADDDFLAVQSAGIAGGRAYVVSSGPASTLDPPPLRLPSVHELALDGAPASRFALSLTPPNAPISIDRSVLFYAQDTILFTQYFLADASSGAVRATDFVRHGSGSTFLYGDHRIGCVVADAPPVSREQSGCRAEAWVTPNYVNGVRDRTVYLVRSDTTVQAAYPFASIARVAGFVGYESAADLLVAVTLADASTELWRVSREDPDARARVAAGDVTLYGTIRPRGSVL